MGKSTKSAGFFATFALVNSPFQLFIQSVKATRSKRVITPFGLYELESHKLLFHFIELKTYQGKSINPHFLKECYYKAGESGYKIITIWEDVWHNHQQLIEARILAMLGQRQRIHARQTAVVRLDKETASRFLEQHHLQGSTGAYYKYGLIFNDELVAVATFSKGRTMYDGPVYYRSYEHERFASRTGLTVTGGLGKLLKHFIETHHAKHIMTYADADWGNGESYLKLGFEKKEHTSPQSFYINVSSMKRVVPVNGAHNRKDLLKINSTGSIKLVLDLQKA